uniref:G protein-coupled receptor n=1 Tax=Panagrolaimus davidi TaxID=227884 RepID=A0A914PIP2_9BILA
MFDEVKPDSVLLWFDTGAVKASNDATKTRILFGIISGGFVVSEIVCLLSVRWIFKILRKNVSSFSAQTYKLHRQMTLLLYLQILNPIIFIWFPIGSCIFAVFLKLDFRKNTGIWGLIFMSFYSISNTLLTIGFVSPYRNFTAKYTYGLIMKLPFLKKYSNVVVIVPIESTTGNSYNSRNVRNN